MTHVSFTHIMLAIIFHECMTILGTKNMHIYNSYNIHFVAHEFYIFVKNVVLNMLMKVKLIKACM